ncbi:MAG TPA: hypothetical protein DF712_17835 [Balneola sp.]|nr:hypothetical protein [Balneola sp.]|tara:strand:+ start:1036 stop:1239 length:204 start_codon:yes stop_codon:yes gene_type:complete
MHYIKNLTDKVKNIYAIIITKEDLGDFDKESKLSFLRFLDVLADILIVFFVIFSVMSLYFFVTHAIL